MTTPTLDKNTARILRFQMKNGHIRKCPDCHFYVSTNTEVCAICATQDNPDDRRQRDGYHR